MRLAFFFYFLTLVPFTANAAPEATIKPAPIQTKEGPAANPDQVEAETLQTTPAPEGLVFIRNRKTSAATGSTNLGLGSAVGQFDKDKETQSVLTYHIQRTQFNSDETSHEFGLALVSNGLFSLDWGLKIPCCFTSAAGPLSPFYKFGVAGFFAPQDALGNFIDYQRYFVQGSIGLDDLWLPKRTWHLELGGRAGYPGSQLFLQIYYAIPD
jgi:hypothetical protein